MTTAGAVPPTFRSGFICDSSSLGDFTAARSPASPTLPATPSYPDLTPPPKPAARSPAERTLRELQSTARRLLDDPDLTQTSAFVKVAPLVAFVYLFAAGAAGLRFADTLKGLDASQGTLCALVLGGGLAFLIGGLFALGLLRACIFGVASTARALAETDVSEWLGGGPRLMDYEVLFGGFTISTEKQ
ncbi:hypothetical protein BD626DRAFT_412743 [Schizophyllum amplum]|uniref:Uncharacterized protein n=1 Tax=Schizophyllum amplum TaxID=97359 RepID=A0A550BWS8_9AGAR|nr:hypothetical protein BD626DRAFT_412743 [Auriculariopsis ampla]